MFVYLMSSVISVNNTWGGRSDIRVDGHVGCNAGMPVNKCILGGTV